MKIIGITGGIGSGKSTFSQFLRNKNLIVIDADKVARDILSKGEKAYIDVLENFGNDILDEAKEIDRKKLADIVFNDSKKLEVLNNISHSYISLRIRKELTYLKSKGESVVFLDVPLLFEVGLNKICDKTLLIYTPRNERISRASIRDGVLPEDIEKRMASQIPDEEKRTMVDIVIENVGSEDELKEKADDIINVLF